MRSRHPAEALELPLKPRGRTGQPPDLPVCRFESCPLEAAAPAGWESPRSGKPKGVVVIMADTDRRAGRAPIRAAAEYVASESA